MPKRNDQCDLTEYAGNYCYGVFCHECNEEDRAAGAWQRGPARTVTQNKGAQFIADKEYLPRGNDVFVRSDGLQMAYFGRGGDEIVSFYVFSSSPDTFEKTND